MKFRSKAQSLNKIKGKLKIPPKLPYFKKKSKGNVIKSSKNIPNYIKVDYSPSSKDIYNSYSNKPRQPFRNLGIKEIKKDPSKSQKNIYFPLKNRMKTQPNITVNFASNKNSVNSWSNWRSSNERFQTDSMHSSKQNSKNLTSSMKFKVNKNIQRIVEPVSFKSNNLQAGQRNEMDEHQRKMHSNFIKNVKNVHSHKSIGSEDEETFAKVVRVSVNGRDVPIENIKGDKQLHRELKRNGYSSFEDNGKKGYRKRSRSRSLNNSRQSSAGSRK